MYRKAPRRVPASEKELDQALDHAFRSDSAFAEWFLRQTRFTPDARYLWSRADHPWGRIPIETTDSATGETQTEIIESETDVLVVFESINGTRFALHIENKLAGGKFQPRQAELYRRRAEHWIGDERYKGYTDYQTVLVAPLAFYNKNGSPSQDFDCYVSHEDLAQFIPQFGAGVT